MITSHSQFVDRYAITLGLEGKVQSFPNLFFPPLCGESCGEEKSGYGFVYHNHLILLVDSTGLWVAPPCESGPHPALVRKLVRNVVRTGGKSTSHECPLRLPTDGRYATLYTFPHTRQSPSTPRKPHQSRLNAVTRVLHFDKTPLSFGHNRLESMCQIRHIRKYLFNRSGGGFPRPYLFVISLADTIMADGITVGRQLNPDIPTARFDTSYAH